jgi:hypothetical protein
MAHAAAEIPEVQNRASALSDLVAAMLIEAKPENLIGHRAYDSDPLPHRGNRSKPPTQGRRRLVGRKQKCGLGTSDIAFGKAASGSKRPLYERPVMLSLFFEPAGTWPQRKCLPDWESPRSPKPSGTLSDLAVAWVDEVEIADVVSRPT